jgi:hypothetical protein
MRKSCYDGAMWINCTQQNYIRPPRKIKVRSVTHVLRSAWRIAPVVLAAVNLLGGCASGPRLESVAAPSDPWVPLVDAGIRVSVVPNTWSAYPVDLWRYYTPVEVRIENTRSEDLPIRYEDFVALDDGQQQYRAVPPGEVARALFGASSPAPPTYGGHPVLLAGRWYPYSRWYWGPYSPYGPWWYYDPYYYPYAWPRSGSDVLALGLREGRLLPGANVQGFLYLQQATARGTSLTLTWTPRYVSGEPMATFSAPFRIIR